MDKNAIKKYAVWARRELIERVSQRAMIYGITAKDAGDPNVESVNGHLLSQAERRQRQALIRNIKTKSYEQVMEEVAYTWFNRFAALRFMEVNGYLPSHIRVFTNDAGEFKPQILAEAIHLELEGLDMNKVYELESANKSEELFKYLLIVQCNALNRILPGMFQRIEDYTELLLPDYLLREGSVIEQMVTSIPEEDWTDQVQIIGWLYQYYNTEPKDKVFADLKKNIKITKETIPAATQQFTPDWIVHYMVENSLGRLWLEGHPNDTLKSEWKYYLDEAEQEPEVQAQLATIRKEYAALKPEEIRVIDPCMGSGHILCVLFDVLVRIYEDYGYAAREAAVKIVENNLWGLDIDDRAAQLSYFAVMMKARQYDRRFFTRKVQPHVYAIHETTALRDDYVHAKDGFRISADNRGTLDYLINAFVDAKEYGSIIQLEPRDYLGLQEDWDNSERNKETDTFNLWYSIVATEVPQLIEQAIALTQTYDVVVTNPPYMGMSGMGPKLFSYVKDFYPETKSDMSTVFMEKTISMCSANGFMAMINIPVWMFIASYEKLRHMIVDTTTLVQMVHFGRGVFGSDFGTTSFVVCKNHVENYLGTYRKLFEKQGAVDSVETKEKWFVENKGAFCAKQASYRNIPGWPIAYWVSDRFISNFSRGRISDVFYSGGRNKTHGNEQYTRMWWEVSDYGRWQLYVKGGDFRRWYGNHEVVVDWSDEAKNEYASHGGLYNQDFAGKTGICWTLITSAKTAFRVKVPEAHYDSGAPTIFNDDFMLDYCTLGFLNTNVATEYLQLLNPTINMGNTYVLSLPRLDVGEYKLKVEALVKENIDISKAEWDSYELSLNFECHPLVRAAKAHALIREAFSEWEANTSQWFHQIQRNENELNAIFVAVYGLDGEVSPVVPDRDIAIRKADLQRDIKSLISYAVGCMFGRYSLDSFGLAYVGGDWNPSHYTKYHADKDAIIPICDDEYFEDDIVGRFVKFVEVVYGKQTLEENLRYIADALGGKGSSRDVIRNYFINDFYADHLKMYQKRPIYWLFDSGKKNGFKCLIYMHRYQPDTIARIRTDYVHEQQSRYRTAIADLEQRINGASTSERVKLSKQLATLQAQAEEIRVYEEKIHHLADQMIKIDLDDGVKHNYEIFKDVLAKIK